MKDKTNKQIAIWLYFGAAAIFIQIILGGITRLTGSGLSITEWKPLLGTLPPMNTLAWQQSFDQYKEIAQFRIVNSHFSLADYKNIYFWEWLHRNWARFIGIAFIIPFVVFVTRRNLTPKLFLQLIILFILGILQAVIGWIMVESGLNKTSLAVNEIKLAIHFIAAIILLCYICWVAFSISIKTKPPQYSAALRNICLITLGILIIQLFFGALMAGSKAALSAPTWPDMNGYFIPPDLWNTHIQSSNTYLLWIQFNHRLLAYISILLIVILSVKISVWKHYNIIGSIRFIPLFLICLQAVLGITTLLNVLNDNYKIYALLHQFVGIVLLVVILLFSYISSRNRI